MSSETLVILNPASGAGSTGRRQESIRRDIEGRLGSVEFAATTGPGDAIRISRAACGRGVERILVAGGDGTTSEVVAGSLAARIEVAQQDPAALVSHATGPILGLLPLGSGCDLARSLDLPRSLDSALEVIAGGHSREIDAGRIEYRDHEGGLRTRAFVNEGSAGLSGKTVQVVGRLGKRIGPRLGFVLGAVSAIVGHRPVSTAVEIDGERIYEGDVSLVVAANGCYFGAGMKVAPGARLDDGRLEIVLVRGLTVPRLLANLPSFYRGRHGRHPSVSFHSARSLELIPKAGSAPIDVDGEAVGVLPMRIEVLPRALRVFASGPKSEAGDAIAGETSGRARG